MFDRNWSILNMRIFIVVFNEDNKNGYAVEFNSFFLCGRSLVSILMNINLDVLLAFDK